MMPTEDAPMPPPSPSTSTSKPPMSWGRAVYMVVAGVVGVAASLPLAVVAGYFGAGYAPMWGYQSTFYALISVLILIPALLLWLTRNRSARAFAAGLFLGGAVAAIFPYAWRLCELGAC